jgi:hypothetical protein
MELRVVLEEVYKNLQSSRQAYLAYLENGKTYRYAKLLMKYNTAICEQLVAGEKILPSELWPDAKALLEHYEIWMAKWLSLERDLSPADEDVFVFQNTHTFPREAAQRIEAAYLETKMS